MGSGGPKRNRLFVTATTSLYAIYLNTNGLPLPVVDTTGSTVLENRELAAIGGSP